MFFIGTSYCLEDEKERTPRIDIGDLASALLGRAETNSQVNKPLLLFKKNSPFAS